MIDVMPTDPAVLGFSNRWCQLAVQTMQPYVLPNGIKIELITAACFLGKKVDAFDSPTREDNGDLFVSGHAAYRYSRTY